jgi:hypothetical protein
MRKVIQIMQEPRGNNILALCDDGSIWRITEGGIWRQLPDIAYGIPYPGSVVSMVYEINGQRYRPIRFDFLKKGDLYLSVEGNGICTADGDSPEYRIIVERI